MAAPINYGRIEAKGGPGKHPLDVAVSMYRTHEGRLVIEITDACDEDVEVIINGHHALANERNYGAWNSEMRD